MYGKDTMSLFVRRYLLTLAAVGAFGVVLALFLPPLLVAVADGVLMVFAAYVVVLADARMLKQIKAMADKITHGQAPEPLVTTRKDELAELGRAVMAMTNRDKAVQQANSDPLTGLANRRGLIVKLETAFRQNLPFALFYIDLDKFKPVNDQYGHEMGDAVLRQVAEILRSCVRDSDTVARLGGDEFVMVYFGLTERKILEERAQRVLDALGEPMWINNTRIKIGGSVGVTVAPGDGASVETIMNAADETMYAVKKAGRNGFKFYS